MYICPTCKRTFINPDKLTSHFLPCWKEHNPNHISKPAPRSEDKIEREVNDEMANFFAMLNKQN